MWSGYLEKWKEELNRETAIRGRGRNKLRTYRPFKKKYCTEYMGRIPAKHRSALSKFRCGVAPLRLETGRYEGLEPDDRICLQCNSGVESEEHVLLQCSLYDDLRFRLFQEIESVVPGFYTWSNVDKLCLVLANNSFARAAARTCFNILHRRRTFLYA